MKLPRQPENFCKHFQPPIDLPVDLLAKDAS